MSRQARKHSIGLAGEFFVAAELLRRGVMASVTYGNAKRADVIAVSPSTSAAAVLEVKSTSQKKWVIGNHVPEPTDNLWVLVHLPADESSPRYFVATAQELHAILAPQDIEYRRRFRERNGKEFSGIGVVSIRLKEVELYEGEWSKVLSRVAAGG